MAWRRAVDAVSPLATQSQDPLLLAPLAIGLLRLGDLERAAPIVDQLRADGYRSRLFVEACREAGLDV